jgi:hypothetical protein
MVMLRNFGPEAFRAIELEIAAKKAKLDDELKAMEIGRTIVEALPSELNRFDTALHLHPLYGRTGSLHVENHRYTSLAPENRGTVSPELGLMLCEYIPWVPMVLVKPGTYFATEAYTESPKCKAQDKDNAIDVCPFYVRASSIHETCDVTWFGTIAGQVIECEVRFPAYYFRHFARWEANIVGHDHRGNPIRRGWRMLEPENDQTKYIPGTSGSLIGSRDYIKFAGGSDTDRGDGIAYWGFGSLDEITPADLFRHLIAIGANN